MYLAAAAATFLSISTRLRVPSNMAVGVAIVRGYMRTRTFAQSVTRLAPHTLNCCCDMSQLGDTSIYNACTCVNLGSCQTSFPCVHWQAIHSWQPMSTVWGSQGKCVCAMPCADTAGVVAKREEHGGLRQLYLLGALTL